MIRWAKFLDSLGTRGGNIFILLIATGGLFAATMHMMHHSDKTEAATVLLSTFSGFSGALLNALVSSSKSASQLNQEASDVTTPHIVIPIQSNTKGNT